MEKSFPEKLVKTTLIQKILAGSVLLKEG